MHMHREVHSVRHGPQRDAGISVMDGGGCVCTCTAFYCL